MKLIHSLPASTLESISQALKAGRLKPPYTAFTVAEWAPQNGRDLLAAELMSLQACGFTTATLAITLEALAEDAAARQRAIDQIQLVWTSPDEEGPHVRDTSVVVRQLLSEARQSLWISTYSIFNGQEVFLPIEEAWSFRPELDVVLILNVPPDDKNGFYETAAVDGRGNQRCSTTREAPRKLRTYLPASTQNAFSWMERPHSSRLLTLRSPRRNGTSNSACCSATTRGLRSRSGRSSRVLSRMDS